MKDATLVTAIVLGVLGGMVGILVLAWILRKTFGLGEQYRPKESINPTFATDKEFKHFLKRA